MWLLYRVSLQRQRLLSEIATRVSVVECCRFVFIERSCDLTPSLGFSRRCNIPAVSRIFVLYRSVYEYFYELRVLWFFEQSLPPINILASPEATSRILYVLAIRFAVLFSWFVVPAIARKSSEKTRGIFTG